MSSPTEKVLSYLTSQNRPYSVNDIFLNLHKEVGKSAVQKALDLLVADEKVREKVNGKQKAYVVNQDTLETPEGENIEEMDALIRTKTAELNQLKEEQKAAEGCLRSWTSKLRTAEVLSELAHLSAEVSTMEKRLSDLVSASGDSRVVSREERDKVAVKRDAAVNEWRRRKRMCEAVIDAVLDSYPKSKRILVDDMGVEVDEDVGVKLPRE